MRREACTASLERLEFGFLFGELVACERERLAERRHLDVDLLELVQRGPDRVERLSARVPLPTAALSAARSAGTAVSAAAGRRASLRVSLRAAFFLDTP